jgi:hypothetical protein
MNPLKLDIVSKIIVCALVVNISACTSVRVPQSTALSAIAESPPTSLPLTVADGDEPGLESREVDDFSVYLPPEPAAQGAVSKRVDEERRAALNP